MRINSTRVTPYVFKGSPFSPSNNQRVVTESKERKEVKKDRGILSDFILTSGIVLGIAGIFGNFIVPRGV